MEAVSNIKGRLSMRRDKVKERVSFTKNNVKSVRQKSILAVGKEQVNHFFDANARTRVDLKQKTIGN